MCRNFPASNCANGKSFFHLLLIPTNQTEPYSNSKSMRSIGHKPNCLQILSNQVLIVNWCRDDGRPIISAPENRFLIREVAKWWQWVPLLRPFYVHILHEIDGDTSIHSRNRRISNFVMDDLTNNRNIIFVELCRAPPPGTLHAHLTWTQFPAKAKITIF